MFITSAQPNKMLPVGRTKLYETLARSLDHRGLRASTEGSGCPDPAADAWYQ